MIDETHFRRAITLALEAEEEGNLPVGTVITLDNKVIAEGKNAIWSPAYNQNKHAEIEALRAVPQEAWPRSREMTLYTTLEPCLMCAGAILLHHIGRVVYGAADSLGGAVCVFGHLPPFAENELQRVRWEGPAGLRECEELAASVLRKVHERQSAGLTV